MDRRPQHLPRQERECRARAWNTAAGGWAEGDWMEATRSSGQLFSNSPRPSEQLPAFCRHCLLQRLSLVLEKRKGKLL